MPTLIQSNTPSGEQCDITCSICMDNINKNKVVLECGHKFHYNCLFTWNQQTPNCPCCRNDIDVEVKEAPIIVESYELNLSYLADHSEDMDITINCKNCSKTIKSCSFCTNAYCECSVTRIYDQGTASIYGVNQFEKNFEESKSCSDCFLNRDSILTELVLGGAFWEDNLEYCIHDNEDLIELYNVFFKNDSSTDFIQEGFCENIYKSYTYDEFKEYVDSLISQSMNEDDY